MQELKQTKELLRRKSSIKNSIGKAANCHFMKH